MARLTGGNGVGGLTLRPAGLSARRFHAEDDFAFFVDDQFVGGGRGGVGVWPRGFGGGAGAAGLVFFLADWGAAADLAVPPGLDMVGGCAVWAEAARVRSPPIREPM